LGYGAAPIPDASSVKFYYKGGALGIGNEDNFQTKFPRRTFLKSNKKFSMEKSRYQRFRTFMLADFVEFIKEKDSSLLHLQEKSTVNPLLKNKGRIAKIIVAHVEEEVSNYFDTAKKDNVHLDQDQKISLTKYKNRLAQKCNFSITGNSLKKYDSKGEEKELKFLGERTIVRFIDGGGNDLSETNRNLLSICFMKKDWKDYILIKEGKIPEPSPLEFDEAAIRAYKSIHPELIDNLMSLAGTINTVRYTSPYHFIKLEDLKFYPYSQALTKFKLRLQVYYDHLENLMKINYYNEESYNINLQWLYKLPSLAHEIKIIYEFSRKIHEPIIRFIKQKPNDFELTPSQQLILIGDNHEDLVIQLHRDYIDVIISYVRCAALNSNFIKLFELNLTLIKSAIKEMGFDLTGIEIKSLLTQLHTIRTEISNMKIERNSSKASADHFERTKESWKVFEDQIGEHMPLKEIGFKHKDAPKRVTMRDELIALLEQQNEYFDLLSYGKMAYHSDHRDLALEFFLRFSKCPEISDISKFFASKTIELIQSPNKYKEALGVLIFNVQESTYAYQAGLRNEDIIYFINEKKINEPFEISAIQGRTSENSQNVYFIERNSKKKRFMIKGSISLGCKSTSLVYYELYQI